MKGTVQFFNNSKGWGFIKRENEADLFVHYTGIKSEGYKTLNEGDVVEFDVARGQKGEQAENVTVITKAQIKPVHRHAKASNASEASDSGN